jgi:LPXTG-motif cell wall-anchored protein
LLGFANWLILGRFVFINFTIVKIEQIIVQYLYANKEVTLQGIGTFRLNPQVAIPVGNEKDFTMPENAIQFEYNLRATEDEGLINFIVQHTRKIKPLATSDLDSYIALAKQFLNIGKPLVIEGVGTVQKNMLGEYEFSPGIFIPAKMDDGPKELKEKKEEAVSFESESRKKGNNNPAIVIIILIIALLGLGIYYFIKKRNTPPPEQVVTEQPAASAPVTDTVKKDTIAKPAVDSNLLKPVIVPKDSFSFKVVIKEYTDTGAANRAYRRLSSYGHKLILYTTDDSVSFKLAMPFMNPLSDTSHEQDSLKVLFGGKPYIQL